MLRRKCSAELLRSVSSTIGWHLLRTDRFLQQSGGTSFAQEPSPTPLRSTAGKPSPVPPNTDCTLKTWVSVKWSPLMRVVPMAPGRANSIIRLPRFQQATTCGTFQRWSMGSGACAARCLSMYPPDRLVPPVRPSSPRFLAETAIDIRCPLCGWHPAPVTENHSNHYASEPFSENRLLPVPAVRVFVVIVQVSIGRFTNIPRFR